MKVVLLILRGLRGATWGVCIWLALTTTIAFERRILVSDLSAPQEAALAGVAAVELIAVYVLARAIDAILKLAFQGLEGPRKSP